MKKQINNFSFNKLTLKFENRAVEMDFRNEIIGGLFGFFKIGIILGILLYSTFTVFDYFESEKLFNAMLINRILIISALFLFLFLFYSSFSFVKKYYYILIIALFLTLGLGVLHATYISKGYLTSVYQVIIFFNLIPFLTIPIIIIINLLLAVIFYLILYYSIDFEMIVVLKETALLVSAIIITFLASYIKQIIERNNYIKTKKIEEAKAQINSQLDELELTHKNITDSINYAKRIQDALLPSEEIIARLPINIELYYKPKNTIGGDFYWVDEVEDNIIVAIGDCTGHGVPGAIMTSLGINGLINSVTEQRMTDPSDILTYLDGYIHGLLSSPDKNNYVKDGMDISVVCINKKLNTISFSNAGRPFIYVDNNVLHQIKAFRRSIGSKLIMEPFTTEVLPISKTATYYMFSDGMTDQFGGEKNKRLKSRVFNQLLLEWGKFSLSVQKNKLIEFYTNYTKSTKQTDDMIWGAIQIK